MIITKENLNRFLKRYGLLLVLPLFIGLFAACDQDFPDPNEPTDATASVQNLVTGATAVMREDLAIYLRVVGSIGRECYYFESADPRYTGELLRGPLDGGGFLVTRPWQARYRAIRNCESIIEKATAGDPADLAIQDAGRAKGALGFAQTVQAYQYLLNLTMTWDNPGTSPLSGDGNGSLQFDLSGTFSTPASFAESWTNIENLLDNGFANLTAADAEFAFVIHSGFDTDGDGDVTTAEVAALNRAIRARVAVYQDDWAAALTALGSSFLDAAGSMDLGVYHIYSSSDGDQENEMAEDPTADFVKLRAHPSFPADAEGGDARAASKALDRNPDLTTPFDDLTSTWVVTTVSAQYADIPMVRNEELLLLRAEANIGLGNFGTAETDLNTVRAAAGLGPVTPLNAGNALGLLLNEKRYSLFMEGHRWVDMRHYGLLQSLPKDRAGDDIVENAPMPETEISG